MQWFTISYNYFNDAISFKNNQHYNTPHKIRKQPPIDVPRKRCSENMQQIYRRTPMPKCNFNKVALQLYLNRTSACVFSCKLAAYFQNTFFQEHLWVADSENI